MLKFFSRYGAKSSGQLVAQRRSFQNEHEGVIKV